jgi:aminoglycoside phosphotransferase (APT) family kinase protein
MEAPDVRAVLARHLPDVAPESLVMIGDGTDHLAYLVDGELIVRFAREPDRALRATRVEREAGLLAAVAAISPLPVPEPVLVVAGEGCLAYRRLPGVPLLEVPEGERSAHARAVATALGRLLRELHATPPDRVSDLVEPDDFSPSQQLEEAAAHVGVAADAIPVAHRRGVDAFLAQPPPAPAAGRVFSHNDLGIEHVLVDPATGALTGIIDWSDAALVDPAYDFGLILRDLGPDALDAALAAYGPVGGALRERVRFHARCALLEDLAYGIEAARPAYAEKSVAALGRLFTA